MAALSPERDAHVDFLLELARALHVYGAPSHVIEETLAGVGNRLGVQSAFFSTPTSIFASFDETASQKTALVRLEPGGTDLGRLVDVDELCSDVVAGRYTSREGLLELRRILDAPPRYGSLLSILAFMMASACAARFFGGGLREIVVAGLIGLATVLLSILAPKRENTTPLLEPGAAAIGAFIATTAHAWIGEFSSWTALLAGLIVLIPGLSLTVAMKELATRHLASGTARLMGAAVQFITIGFGVAFGRAAGIALAGLPACEEIATLPLWTEGVALLAAPLSFAVLFRARRRDVGWVLLAGVIAFLSARIGATRFAPEIAVCLGATLVGIASNLYARALDRPGAVMLVPGIMLLVPGSLGFRSVQSLLEDDVLSGIQGAFTTLLIGAALVAGLLFANAAVHPRRPAELRSASNAD